jgi:enoyl-[acyl-carrier protein] reductase III
MSAAAGSVLDFSGQTALVTGGTRGIGAAISQALAARGARVLMNFRDDEESAARTLAAIEAGGGSARLVKANLVRPEDVRLLGAAAREAGGLDILVHGAALGSFKRVLDVKPNQWDLSLAVNARAFLLLAQELAPLLEGRGGRIVALSSLGGQRVVPEYGAIGVSKAALEAVVRSLAVELGPRGVRVNAVAAGIVDTPTIRRHPHHEDLVARALERTPERRLATPDDVAGVVLFLCSPLSRWVNGQTIVADGGMSLAL